MDEIAHGRGNLLFGGGAGAAAVRAGGRSGRTGRSESQRVYGDVESLTFKTRGANGHDLCGVFFWEIMQARPENAFPVQEAVRVGGARGQAAQLP